MVGELSARIEIANKAISSLEKVLLYCMAFCTSPIVLR